MRRVVREAEAKEREVIKKVAKEVGGIIAELDSLCSSDRDLRWWYDENARAKARPKLLAKRSFSGARAT